jgi:hypothetical protein
MSEGTGRAKSRPWTPAEDNLLRDAVEKYGAKNWKEISALVVGRNDVQCKQRWSYVLRPGIVKGRWTIEEDAALKKVVAGIDSSATQRWKEVATRMDRRTQKMCRDRWVNHLDPSIKRANFSVDEDQTILDQQTKGIGWSLISAMLPGRPPLSVKNRFKSLMLQRTKPERDAVKGLKRIQKQAQKDSEKQKQKNQTKSEREAEKERKKDEKIKITEGKQKQKEDTQKEKAVDVKRESKKRPREDDGSNNIVGQREGEGGGEGEMHGQEKIDAQDEGIPPSRIRMKAKKGRRSHILPTQLRRSFFDL